MTRTKGSSLYYKELLTRTEHKAHEILHIGNDARKDLPAVQQGINVFLLTDLKNRGSHKKAWTRLSSEEQKRCFFGTWGELDNLLRKELSMNQSKESVANLGFRTGSKPPLPSQSCEQG
jgi:hypothetical protein